MSLHNILNKVIDGRFHNVMDKDEWFNCPGR